MDDYKELCCELREEAQYENDCRERAAEAIESQARYIILLECAVKTKDEAIERLSAERDEARTARDVIDNELSARTAELAAPKPPVQEDAKDASRYRFLIDALTSREETWIDSLSDDPTKEELVMLIDKAMKESKE